MKIILSRKGFDSKNGGVPSPILPDGTLVSLPIPAGKADKGAIRYDVLRAPKVTLGRLVDDLTDGTVTPRHRAHLDPDLRESALATRKPGWRPIFGQGGKAQSHLAWEEVDEDDLFLFFGWFRQTEKVGGHYRFVRGTPHLHVLFGWLQIAEICEAGPALRASAQPWARYHSHYNFETPRNTVYIARKNLKLPGLRQQLPGAGVFSQFIDDLCLTAPTPNKLRSIWQLPRWFMPTKTESLLSCHHDIERWKLRPGFCQLKTVNIGQEFVLDADNCPEATKWAKNLITNAAKQV